METKPQGLAGPRLRSVTGVDGRQQPDKGAATGGGGSCGMGMGQE